MFIPGSCDIGFLCSNNASYYMELINQDFETQVERYEETSKLEVGGERYDEIINFDEGVERSP